MREWTWIVVLGVVLAAEPWLGHEWMYLGLGGALFLLVAWSAEPRVAEGRGFAFALLVAYLVHQFEEHGYDALGRPYAFLGHANGFLGPVLGCAPGSECPLNVDAVFWVNTLLVWAPFLTAFTLGRTRRFPTVAVAGLTLINAVAHIVPAVLQRAYDPGLLTGVLVFLPLAGRTLFEARRAWGVPRWQVALALAWGAAGHALLGTLAFAVYTRGLLPHAVYPVVLAVYGALPTLGGGSASLPAHAGRGGSGTSGGP